jgi:hypothetical protein
VVVSSVVLCAMVFQAREEIKSETSPYAYKAASHYLATHCAPGSMIFNTNWDAFPALFYYNPDYAYVSGLDPSYLYDRDHDLWKLYESIVEGDEENAAVLIRDRFGAKYVVTGNGDSDFLTNARDSSGFEVVYEDSEAVVLRVRDADEQVRSDSEGSRQN